MKTSPPENKDDKNKNENGVPGLSNGKRPDDDGKNGAPSRKTPAPQKKKNTDESAETRVSPELPVRRQNGSDAEKDAEEQTVKVVKRHHNSAPFAFVFTAAYLILVVAAAILISALGLSVAKEAFALEKNGVDVTVTITGDYLTIDDVAKQLKAQHVIEHPFFFKLYAKVRHKANAEFVAGTATVTPEMGYDAMLSLFIPQPEPRGEIAVAVPEGYTVDDIIDLFVSKGIGTREAFEYVINEYPFSSDDYWFLEGVEMKPGRIYRLEGYLYPDTYFFYDSYPDKEGDIPGTAGAKAVVVKMLNEFNKNFKKRHRDKYVKYLEENYPGMEPLTLDEIITLASVLEKEGLAAERSTISAVFYNRLNNPEYEAINRRLESNATVLYAIKHNEGAVSGQFTDYEKNYESAYNSYLHEGLPPGPIVSPSIDSINAALYPLKGCTYYYFVATDSHYSFFAETKAEHEQNVERAKNGEVADPYEDQDDEGWGEEDYNE